LTHINHTTFCNIPFTKLSTENNGSYLHCCYAVPSDDSVIEFTKYGVKNSQGTSYTIKDDVQQVWNSDFYKKLRHDLISGVQNTACKYCWDKEQQGAHSYRQTNSVVPANLSNILNQDYTMSVGPSLLDVKIGNFCNLKCIMCHPINSTEHVAEIKQWRKQGIIVPKFVDMLEEEFELVAKSFDGDQFFNGIISVIDTITEIQFYGGEPLASIEVLKLLDRLIKDGYSNNIIIKMITNLSITNEKIFSKLEEFKSVELVVSWDHHNATVSNFIRYPIDYNKFLANFDYIKSNPLYNIKISNTISIFNIFDIPAMYDMFENLDSTRNITIAANLLEIPDYFSIQYLKQSQKELIANMLDDYLEKNKLYKIFNNTNCFKVLSTIKNLMMVQPTNFIQVVDERNRALALYDDTRNTNSKALFPYLYE
jgi:MoaA/NifB/PqqE/SkfB family radical SAM enzyme